MSTKEKKTAEVSKVSLVSEKEYKDRSSKSGVPLMKNDVSTRCYSNPHVNGTTKVLLAAIAANRSNLNKETVNVAD